MTGNFHWMKLATSKNISNFYLFLITFATVLLLYTSYDVIISNVGGIKTVYLVASDLTVDEDNFLWENESLQFRWCPPIYDDTWVSNLDCHGVFAGNKSAIEVAKNWTSPCTFSDESMMNITSSCSEFKKDFPFYWPRPSQTNGAESESKYPLAFVIMVAQNAEQIVRLFQSIYRPWNLYCLTYDNDTSYQFQQTMHNIDSCYDNIVMPETFVEVNWAGFSILQTAVNCLSVLNSNVSKIEWNYVQIVSWNDFPLKTNRQMVEIMRILNGSQDAELSDGQPERFRQFHKESNLDESKKSLKKPLPPGNMIIYKGSMAATLSRDFIKFIFENPLAIQFYNWSETMWAPEEQFWSTLVHNVHTGVPGGFPGNCLAYYHFDKIDKPFISRYQIWYDDCNGKIKSGSCVFGAGDLQKMIASPHLVAHKMYLNFEPATLYCLSEFIYNRSFGLTNDSLDLNYYYNLPSVRYQNSVDKNNFQC